MLSEKEKTMRRTLIGVWQKRSYSVEDFDTLAEVTDADSETIISVLIDVSNWDMYVNNAEKTIRESERKHVIASSA